MSRFVLSIIILFFYGVAMASDRYINIVTPDGNSMIDPAAPVTVSGTGKGLFEGNVVIRFEDLDGKLLVQEPTTCSRRILPQRGSGRQAFHCPGPCRPLDRMKSMTHNPKTARPLLPAHLLCL